MKDDSLWDLIISVNNQHITKEGKLNEIFSNEMINQIELLCKDLMKIQDIK